MNANSLWGRFFSRESTATAITVYIVIVNIIYNIILRFIWNPQGLQKIADELLHLIIPALFLLYWLIFVAKEQLKWKNAFTWMIYPLIYGIFVLIRGYFSDSQFYRYPFIVMSKLGVKNGIMNVVGFTGIFLYASLLFIGLGN